MDLSGSSQGAGGVGGLLSMTVYTGANVGTYDYTYDGNGNVASLINTASGTVAGQWEYGPFGEVIRSTGLMAKANPIRFSTKYQDDETALCYYGYRYYDPAPGRWPNRDPLEEDGGLNLYGLGSNDAIDYSDYLGEINVKQLVKQLITGSVTESADAVYNFVQNHGLSASDMTAINALLPYVKRSANSFVDTNTKTMGWRDLTFAWLFELGASPNFKFVDGDKTTEDVKKLKGVDDARKQARSDCMAGKHSTDKPFTYGVDQFWASMSGVDTATIFLGSYSVTVKSSNDCKQFDFIVYNASTWESATRFRKGATPGSQHRAIIANRSRNGPGIQLGGNMDETWTWTEKCGQ
jgi:RHS repeat-associated protein